MGFPIITKLKQMQFERKERNHQDNTPTICGSYGRACRQIDKPEGANRAICMRCPLADFATNKANPALNALYGIPDALGYPASDEENQLRDGTHPMFYVEPGKKK